MTMSLKEQFLRQIDATIELDKTLAVPGQGLEDWQYERLITEGLAAIERITGKTSVYMQQATAAAKLKSPNGRHTDYYAASRTVLSILQSVRSAVVADYLDTASS